MKAEWLFLFAAALLGTVGGYFIGAAKADAYAPDVSKEEAFRAGYMMRECDGGELFRPVANMTADCQEWFVAFCSDHPKTYRDGCNIEEKPQ